MVVGFFSPMTSPFRTFKDKLSSSNLVAVRAVEQ